MSLERGGTILLIYTSSRTFGLFVVAVELAKFSGAQNFVVRYSKVIQFDEVMIQFD